MAILSAMWQKLAGKKPTAKLAEAHDPEPTATTLMAKVSQIPFASKDSIPDQYLPLWQLLNQRQFIEVKVEGSSLTYQTLILAIDIQRGLLWLDDLFPNQHALDVGDRITLRHHRNGEQLSCSSPILAWGSSYGATGLAIMLPEQTSYVPRRQLSRAHLNNNPHVTHNLAAKIRPIGQDISYGSVLDISSGGLRISVPGNLLSQIRHGALVPLCELNLSDELNIRCSARVRSFRLVRSPHRNTQISLEFVDLPQERALQLQQFINNLIYLQHQNDHLELRSA